MVGDDMARQRNLQLVQDRQEAYRGQAVKKNTYLETEVKKKLKVKLGFVFVFAAINISLLLFLNSPHFNITGIHIKGLDKVSSEEIHQEMGIREGINTWKASPPEISSRLEEIPRVKSVEVERSLPGELHIIIAEKEPLALVPYHGYYLELSSDGKFIGIKDEYESELIMVNGLVWGRMDVGTGVPDRGRGEVLEEILKCIEQMPTLPLAEINVEDPQQIVGYSWDGMEIRFGGEEEMSKKMEVLDKIYDRILSKKDVTEGYLDLKVVEAPVFRPVKNN